MSLLRLLLLLPVLSGIWLIISVVVAGAYYPDYSHVGQLMSELGADRSPHGNYMNVFGFLVAELLMMGFVAIAVWQAPKTKRIYFGFGLLMVYAVALAVAAFYPCDFECRPAYASSAHLMHLFSSFLGYVSAILAVFILSSASPAYQVGKWNRYLGYVIGVVAIVLLSNLDQVNPKVGLYQRLLELLIYGWIILFSVHLYRYKTREHE